MKCEKVFPNYTTNFKHILRTLSTIYFERQMEGFGFCDTKKKEFVMEVCRKASCFWHFVSHPVIIDEYPDISVDGSWLWVNFLINLKSLGGYVLQQIWITLIKFLNVLKYVYYLVFHLKKWIQIFKSWYKSYFYF